MLKSLCVKFSTRPIPDDDRVRVGEEELAARITHPEIYSLASMIQRLDPFSDVTLLMDFT